MDDSSKFIQNINFLREDVSAIKETLNNHDGKLLTLINQHALIVRSLEKLAQGKKQSASPKSKIKDKKKLSAAAKTGSDTNWSHLLHLPNALQQNITIFINDLAFQPTELTDKLIEEGCLNESECESICARPSQADQIRLLIKKIKNRGPETIKKFLDLLKKDKANDHLVTAVNDSVKQIVERNKHRSMCAYCIIRKTVDLKDIADHLWGKQLISDEVYDSITETDVLTNMQLLWSLVFYYINNAKDPYTAKQVLQKSLDPKYKHLIEPLAAHQEQVQHPGQRGLLTCTCRARRSLVQKYVTSGSQTDFSSISDFQSKKEIPYFYLFQSDNSESDNYPSLGSDLPSSNLSSFNFTDLGKFDDKQIEQGNEARSGAQMSPDTTTADCDILLKANEEKMTRSRHSSGKFQPQDHDQLESGQFASLPFVSGENLTNTGDNATNVFTDKPDYLHSLSNTTVVSTSSVVKKNSSEDVMMKMSDSNATITPDTDKDMNLSPKTSDGMPGPSSTSPDQENKLPKLTWKLPGRPRRSQTYRLKSGDSSSSEDNNSDDEIAYRRTRHKTYRSRYLNRQRSAPSGFILTKPKPKAESTVGVRTMKTGGKKSSIKRADRRKRANTDKMESGPPAHAGVTLSLSLAQVSGDDRYNRSIPYNPTWAHRPQQRTTSQWDHNQARRYWRMAQLLSASNTTGPFHSDSDLRTEESDAVAFTDDNTV